MAQIGIRHLRQRPAAKKDLAHNKRSPTPAPDRTQLLDRAPSITRSSSCKAARPSAVGNHPAPPAAPIAAERQSSATRPSSGAHGTAFVRRRFIRVVEAARTVAASSLSCGPYGGQDAFPAGSRPDANDVQHIILVADASRPPCRRRASFSSSGFHNLIRNSNDRCWGHRDSPLSFKCGGGPWWQNQRQRA